ncbi:MAG: substrate-binding domain-containing protein, partial [Reyranella sp.]|nr:substrate-binding domain-containing protein [Reyranella sp.]
MTRTSFAALLGAVLLAGAAMTPVQAQVIGVSWSNFQEERWKTDEAAIKAAIAAGGGTYVSADAQSNAAKQITDIEALIARGAKALIVLAQDA